MAEFAIASQFVHYGAVLLLFGASLFRLYAGAAPAAGRRKREHSEEDFERWLWKTLLAAAVAAFLSAIAWWDSLAVTMGDGWSDALNGEVVAAVLFETEFGRIWIWRLALLALLIGTLILLRRLPWSRRNQVLVACLAGVAVFSLTPIGHAARDTGLDEVVHLGAKTLHLLGAAVWLGGLVPLGYILGKAARDRFGASALARRALPRFSWAGYFAVSLILLSGCVIGWFHVGTLAALIGTLYGRVLIAKICLFLLMAAFALFNRLRLTPAMLAPRTRGTAPVATLWKSIAIEQAVGISILLVAATLATLPPAHAG